MKLNSWSVPDTEVSKQIVSTLDTLGTDVLPTIVDVEGNASCRPGAGCCSTRIEVEPTGGARTD